MHMKATPSNGKSPARICSIGILLTLATSLFASNLLQSGNTDAERKAAFDAYDQGRMVDAMPLLEALAAKYPSDIVIREHWAFSTLLYSATLTDAEQRKKARARARKIAVEAQRLGDNSPLLLTVLDVPEDGSEALFSNRPDVD